MEILAGIDVTLHGGLACGTVPADDNAGVKIFAGIAVVSMKDWNA